MILSENEEVKLDDFKILKILKGARGKSSNLSENITNVCRVPGYLGIPKILTN